MTEDEMRKTRCPKAHLAQEISGLRIIIAAIYGHHCEGSNGAKKFAGNKLESDRCIASDCACWVVDKYRFGEDGIRVDCENNGHCGLIR